ncbi:MAG: ACT domain-containing protein [Nitrospirae bacterium]|nr:ACT domain-containing protein [Nitrospirota bacterium]
MKELSLILRNVPGQLAQVADTCALAQVNIRGLCVAETEHISLLRLVVDDFETAAEALGERFHVGTHEVVELEISNRPGTLSRVAKLFAEEGVNIDYAYVAVSPDGTHGTVVLGAGDVERARSILRERRIKFF